MATVLLEIGTEELPGSYLASALAQLSALVRARLQAERIALEEVQTWGTPRRLALLITGLALQQTPAIREVRGPAVNTAFAASGEPTPAAIGFARSQGMPVSELRIKRLEAGEFVVAIYRDEGRLTAEMLPAIFTALITDLTFPKTMRWGDGTERFARPIRWLVALLDDLVLPVTFGAVTAGRLTRGHRFLAPGEVEILHAEDYHRIMEENQVLVAPEERRATIQAQLDTLVQHDGAVILDDGTLLDDATYHLEYPTAVRGAFNPDFLSLPEEVLLQVLRGEQHFFPLADPTGKLLPAFLAVRNGDKAYLSNVREGYEAVAHAKLLDALFFFEQDRKRPLADRLEELHGVVFLEKLGSLHDKALRLQRLAGIIADRLGFSEAERALAERAGLLAKADLVTALVVEHPELQGAIGRAYAWRSGEPQAVSTALGEQYRPCAAGDAIPSTPIGRVVALADKLDTLAACFSVGIIPTGSEDPYALRREMTGVVRILAESQWRLSLGELFSWALTELSAQLAVQSVGETLAALLNFARGRVESVLAAATVSPPVVRAVLAVSADVPADALARARVLEGGMGDPLFTVAVRAAGRLANIVRGGIGNELHSELLIAPAERELYDQYLRIDVQARELVVVGDFSALLPLLAALAPAVDRFFSDVMVMADDPHLRETRLALVCRLAELYRLPGELAMLG